MEILKEFLKILLVHCISLYKNHKNITCENFTKERVLFWCLMLEKCGPIKKYTVGPDNYSADDLRRFLLIGSDVTKLNIKMETLYGRYCVYKLDCNTFPLTHRNIDIDQQKEK